MRYIRLPELKPGLKTQFVPPSSYLETTNGTLERAESFLRIDDNGFMVTPRAEQEGDRRILVLGGSGIENLYIPEDRRVFARIEASLPAHGVSAKVYSAAVSNTDLLHIINVVMNKGLPLRPAIVVYYVTYLHDLVANELEHGFWNEATGPIRVQGVDPPSPLDLLLRGKRRVVDLGDEQRLLRVLSTICAAFEMPLLMSTWPVYDDNPFARKLLPDRSVAEADRAQVAAVNRVVREAHRECHCAFLDLEEHFKSLDHQTHFYDLAHPNTVGCEKIAELTVRALLPLLA